MSTENKVIIFDYDGVIANSFDCFYGAYKKACQKLGYNELANENTMLQLFEHNFYEAVYQKLNKESGRLFLKTLGTCLKEAGTNYKIFDGMVDVLEKLGKITKVFIVTANIGEVVKQHLENNGVNAIPQILGAEIATSKLERINKIKNIVPNATYFFVSDTLGDIREAHLAGIKTIAVLWGWHNSEILQKGSPHYIVSTPKELLAIINQKN